MAHKRKIQYKVNEFGCHICTSHSLRNGYPVIRDKGKHKKISRYIYELYNGEIPKGMYVTHNCDNKLCINPQHLKLGTPKDNVREALERGLFKFGEESVHTNLTGIDAINIFKSKDTNISLSKKYNLSASAIRAIKTGHSWKRYLEARGYYGVNNLKKRGWRLVKFTKSTLKQMINDYNNGVAINLILNKYNISRSHFYHIRKKYNLPIYAKT